jgi:hypothetical protein
MPDREEDDTEHFDEKDLRDIRRTLIRIDERTQQRQKRIESHDERLDDVEDKAAKNRNWIGTIKAGIAAAVSLLGAAVGALAVKVFNLL